MSVTMMHFAGFMLNNSVYILLLYLFLSKMSTPRFGRTMTVLQFVGALALCQTFNMIQIAPINLAIHLGSVLTLSLFTFRNEVKKGLLYGLFYTLISVIAELLSVSALMMVLGGKITETALEAHNMLIINFVNCLICYVFYMAIMAMIARKDAMVVHLSELLMFTFTAVLEMFVAIEYAQNIAKRSDGVKLLLILIGFLALDIYFIITISRIADSYQTRYDNSLLHKQNEIQLAHYVELEKNYAESRKVIHDIKKHLAILSELKSDGTLQSIKDNYESENAGSSSYSSPEGTDHSKGPLVMATNAEFPPYEYRNGDQIVGFDVDMMTAVCDKLGYELQIEDMAFDSIISAVQSGKADVGVAGMSVTPDREKNVLFSDTYTTTHLVVMVRKDS